MTNSNDKTALIRSQNDEFRSKTGIPVFAPEIQGRKLMTPGIRQQSPEDIIAIWAKVRDFSGFSEDNDPHGEHDFGALDHGGQRFFWKIDYYDTDYGYGSENPSDLTKTRRVLTIMLAEEY